MNTTDVAQPDYSRIDSNS